MLNPKTSSTNHLKLVNRNILTVIQGLVSSCLYLVESIHRFDKISDESVETAVQIVSF